MIDKNILTILTHLRKNAKESLITIAKKTNTPQSTVYERTRNHGHLVKKNIPLLDFQKLGINSQTHFVLRVDKTHRNDLEQYFLAHPNINTLYRISELDYLAEGVFKNLYDAQQFFELLESRFPIIDIQKFTIIQELKREEFLTDPEHINILE